MFSFNSLTLDENGFSVFCIKMHFGTRQSFFLEWLWKINLTYKLCVPKVNDYREQQNGFKCCI